MPYNIPLYKFNIDGYIDSLVIIKNKTILRTRHFVIIHFPHITLIIFSFFKALAPYFKALF